MSNHSQQTVQVKALTVNIAGGKPADRSKPDKLGDYLKNQNFDFVCCQEASIVEYGNGSRVSLLDDIRGYTGGDMFAGYFSASVDTDNHPCPDVVPGTGKSGKWYSSKFVDSDSPVAYAAQGNGFLVSSRWELVDLFGGTRRGGLATTIASDFGLFLGDRETEPRTFSVIRARHKESGTECFIGNTHLTTFRKENEKSRGSKARFGQIRRILQVCHDLPRGIPIILAGDFNAELQSPELKLLGEANFLAATDNCSVEDRNTGTHREKNLFIDHFFYTHNTGISFGDCHVVNLGKGISDHNPVMFSFTLPAR